MKRESLYLFMLILLTFSCKHDPNEVITYLKALTDTPQSISAMLKSHAFIKLETTDESLIGNYIGKIKKAKNKYYISCDRKELLIFDDKGLFISKIRKTGNGAGEYAMLCDYDVFENGNIAILDAKKIIVYDKDGAFMHTIPIDIMIFNIKIVNDDRILYILQEKNMPFMK